MLLAIVIGFAVLYGAALYFLQRQLSFPSPGPYQVIELAGYPTAQRIDYDTPDGRQAAFYLPPANGGGEDGVPETLWVAFNGNASLALWWVDVIEDAPNDNAAWLLVDYPGYGFSEGGPSREGVIRNGREAYVALARHLGAEPEALEKDLNVLGYSMGSAAALEFATRHNVQSVLLMAPYTSLMDMAKTTVVPPYHLLLRDRFDNRARLAELAQQDPAPAVTIIHGTADNIIPVAMGEELAGSYPSDRMTFIPIENVDHNFLAEAAKPHIHDAVSTASKRYRQP
ncbi:MAG: alpha/beta hydrolase [Sumerlaeia bacterium]